MTREQKIVKRKLRAKKRREARTAHRVHLFNKAIELKNRYGITLWQAKKSTQQGGSWPDNTSPTGYSQICSWEAAGICQSPCNGDC